MTSTTLPASPAKGFSVALWLLRALMGALFIMAAGIKLTGQPMMVREFDVVGLGQWFRIATGLLELVGGVAILIPAVSAPGAALLLLVDIGAFIAQVAVIHMDWIHTIVIGALLVVVIVLQRGRLQRFLGR
jgi:putative oxidoreductase